MMKKLIAIAAVVATATVLYAGPAPRIDKPACSDIGGNVYVAAYGGMNLWQTGINGWNGAQYDGKSRKIGWNAGFKVGYDFDPAAWVRPVLELESFYNAFNQDLNRIVRETKIGESFKVNSQAMMFNALGKFDCGNWQPYAGAGIGVYTLAADINNTQGGHSSYKATGLAWQLMAGTDYKLDANWALFLEYKWLNYVVAGYKNKPLEGNEYTKRMIGQQLVNLGVRYTF